MNRNTIEQAVKDLENLLAPALDGNRVLKPGAAEPFFDTLLHGGTARRNSFLWRTKFTYLGTTPNALPEAVAINEGGGGPYFKPAKVMTTIRFPSSVEQRKWLSAGTLLSDFGMHLYPDIEEVVLLARRSEGGSCLACTDGILEQIPQHLRIQIEESFEAPACKSAVHLLLGSLEAIGASRADLGIFLPGHAYKDLSSREDWKGLPLLETLNLRQSNTCLICNPHAIHFVVHHIQIPKIVAASETFDVNLETAFTPILNTQPNQAGSVTWR